MATTGTIQILQLLDAFEELGIDRARLTERARVPLHLTDDPKARVPWRFFEKLLIEAERATADPLIGLRAGAATTARGVLAHLFMSQETLEDGVREYVRLVGHASEALRCRLEARPGRLLVCVAVESCSVAAIPLMYEYSAGFFSRLIRDTVHSPGAIAEIELPHAPRGAVREYQRLLGAPLGFRRPTLTFTFTRPALEQRMPTANPRVVRLLRDELTAEHRLADEDGFAVRVERALESSVLRGGGTTEEAVAHALAVSVRTLQRCLGEQGTSFRRIRADVLHRIGGQLLGESSTPVAEIANRLGFANVTAFGKAFRRWSGSTPSAYRSAAAVLEHRGAGATTRVGTPIPLRSDRRTSPVPP